MQIKVADKAGITVLRLTGNLDSTSTPELETHLARLIDSGTRRVVVDLTEVDFVSSAGLGVLLFAAQSLAPSGGTLRVCCPNDAVRYAFDASGFSKILSVFENEQDALSMP
ncbi:MAG: STAS domain-containing protein [Planctomycetota bacterium]|jgi:anti-anti-sigma factor